MTGPLFISYTHVIPATYTNVIHLEGKMPSPQTNHARMRDWFTPSIPPDSQMPLHLKKESFDNFPIHCVPGKPGTIFMLYENNSEGTINTYI